MSTSATTLPDMFFFGPPARRLFGALHEAETYAQREHGVVLCYPFINEYFRSHRAFHQLALHFAHEGFPVLRFDYGTTGDSAGEAEDSRLSDWRTDITLAIDELRDRAGVELVCLTGLRLGASLALEVAGGHDDVSALVLWEPVVDGQDYLAELAEQHQEMLWRFFDNPDDLESNSASECLGFPMDASLRGELAQIDLLTTSPVTREQALIVASQPRKSFETLRDHLLRIGADVEYELIPSFAIWREDIDKGLVPEPVLRGIVAWAARTLA